MPRKDLYTKYINLFQYSEKYSYDRIRTIYKIRKQFMDITFDPFVTSFPQVLNSA